MNEQNYTTEVAVARTPQQVYDAVGDVRGWWSESVVGDTATAGAAWDYRYQDLHRCRIRVAEAVPGERVVWEVLENYFSFTEDPREWVGTRMVFDLRPTDSGTRLTFTHEGLVESHECYGACVQGWDFYIGESLRTLVETGTGRPSTFDHRDEAPQQAAS
jgi:Activator of Hsp90 ATPase homolog 1-like protein